MADWFTRRLDVEIAGDVDTDYGGTLGRPGTEARGVYAERPLTARKYDYTEARDNHNDLRVARLYLTGDLTTLPAPATSFQRGAYVGFYLQEVVEKATEKTQLIPLNGDSYAALFFGEEPRVYSFSGVLENTYTDNWRSTLNTLYHQVLRGSQLSYQQRLAQVAYNGKVVTGAILSMTNVLSAQSDDWAKFSFEFLVSSEYDMWASREADLERMERAFIGDTSLFAAAPVPSVDYVTLDQFTRTAFVAPPPRPNRKGRGKVDCTKGSPAATRDINAGRVMDMAALAKRLDGCSFRQENNAISTRLSELERRRTRRAGCLRMKRRNNFAW